MTLKELVESNPVFWLLAAIVAGFGSGFGAYRVILETARNDVIPRGTYTLNSQIPDKYVPKADFDGLQSQLRALEVSRDSVIALLHRPTAQVEPAPQRETFLEPTYLGIRLDACYAANTGCGDQPANAWCKEKGYKRAAEHSEENVGSKGISTKQIGSQLVCSATYCAAFKAITCEA